MPSIISHSIVGLAAGDLSSRGRMSRLFWDLTIVCAILPDIDVLGLRFGITYGDFFGHRGFFHSIFFAMLVAICATLIFYRSSSGSRRWRLYFPYFFAVSASHGVLDAFTNGGLGVALLSPFDSTRYFFPWRPIHVAPLGISGLFSGFGLEAIKSEMFWVWLPAVILILSSRLIRYYLARRKRRRAA